MSIDKELEKSVSDYCNAAANLYYCISARKLLEIYNSQNKPMSEEKFSEILESLLAQKQFFDFFSADEIENGVHDDTPIIEKELLSEHLYCLGDFADYFELKAATRGLPYHILEKEQFLKYADEFYVEKTPDFISLRAYFRSIPSLTRVESDDLAHETIDTMRLFDRDSEYVFERMKKMNILPEKQCEIDDLTELLYSVSRTIRLATLRGATVEEHENS